MSPNMITRRKQKIADAKPASNKFDEKLHEVNSHRDALGYQRFPNTIRESELDRHMKLIKKHAPYGNDPWALDGNAYERTPYYVYSKEGKEILKTNKRHEAFAKARATPGAYVENRDAEREHDNGQDNQIEAPREQRSDKHDIGTGREDPFGMATDPPVSQAQRGAMWAAKEGKSTLGIPKKVGAEFAAADPGGSLPQTKDAESKSLLQSYIKETKQEIASLMKILREYPNDPETLAELQKSRDYLREYEAKLKSAKDVAPVFINPKARDALTPEILKARIKNHLHIMRKPAMNLEGKSPAELQSIYDKVMKQGEEMVAKNERKGPVRMDLLNKLKSDFRRQGLMDDRLEYDRGDLQTTYRLSKEEADKLYQMIRQ